MRPKVHLTRVDGSERRGWWCAKDPVREYLRWVSNKWDFLKFDPDDRCAKCGLLRDLDEFKRRDSK